MARVPSAELTEHDVDIDREDIKKLMKDRVKRAKAKSGLERDGDRNADKTDVGFWICLVFQSYEQKEEFLQSKLLREVPTINDQYVDGQTLAKAIGVRVTPNTQKPYDVVVKEKLSRLTLKAASSTKKESRK